MDSMVEIYIERSKNEILVAEILKRISDDNTTKKDFNIPEGATFYSSVISHSYYAIFYAAKAILLTKNIKTESPEIHSKTYNEFERNFVRTGILDVKLLEIYSKLVVRADELLGIFKTEKKKRGTFTYNTIAQVNKGPAGDSLQNSKFFVSNISQVIKIMKK